MKICFIGPANSSHIKKWTNWFLKRQYDVHLITFTEDQIPGVKIHYLNLGVDPNGSDWSKIKYLFAGIKIKNILKEINPDIVNVHYASSYGCALALSTVSNYSLSVWGADIYDFPLKSFLHKMLLKFSLKRATKILSTSEAMKLETQKYTSKEIIVTPFGVDLSLFNPSKRYRKQDNKIVIGTIKSLSDKYGIKNILEATAILKDKVQTPIELWIAGKGPQELEYKNYAVELGIESITNWLGYLSQEEVAIRWANMDIALIPSTLESESFGVSAVEAEASGIPVIVSDISGLKESTKPGDSSIVVPCDDSISLSEAIIELINNKQLRTSMGRAGRNYVESNFEIDKCFEMIERTLKNLDNL